MEHHLPVDTSICQQTNDSSSNLIWNEKDFVNVLWQILLMNPNSNNNNNNAKE